MGLKELITNDPTRVIGSTVYPTPGAEERGLLPKHKGNLDKALTEMHTARREGATKGMAGTERPGRLAKRAFEARPTRTAVRIKGEVTRGNLADIHSTVLEKVSRERGVPIDDLIDEMYDPITNRRRPGADQGFTIGREGKYVTRDEMQRLTGKFGESDVQRLEHRRAFEADPAGTKAALRAGSQDPVQQHKRKMRGEKFKLGMKKINSEIDLLQRGNTRESPESLRRLESLSKGMVTEKRPEFKQSVVSRITQLVKRRGTLKNLAKKAGVFSFFVTPHSTGEALGGITSSDLNERMRSMEHLFGLPEFSTGRGLSTKEKKDKAVYIDPRSGEVKM